MHWVARVKHTGHPIGLPETDPSPGRTRKKPKDISGCDTCESVERGRGEGGGVRPTLMESDEKLIPLCFH